MCEARLATREASTARLLLMLLLLKEKSRERWRASIWDVEQTRGWSEERCVRGIHFKDASFAVSMLGTSLKLEVVLAINSALTCFG